jgi:hypothetical protein
MVIETDTLILGAGLTGLSVAAGLRRDGGAPVVLEKSRGTGGRCATRRVGDLRFDHGCQVLRPKDAAVAAALEALERAGAAARWDQAAANAPAWVGLPGMSGLVKPLGHGTDIRTGVRATHARREGGAWRVTDAQGTVIATAARLICAIPAPQAAQVLAGHPLAARIAAVVMDPCWTLMAAFDSRPDLPDVLATPGTALPWIARDGSKPGRGTQTWVAQASPDWTRAHLDLSQDDAAIALLAELRSRAGGTLPGASYCAAHRWLYAQAAVPLGEACLSDPASGLVVAGDWCLGPRAEHAMLSANAALAALRAPAAMVAD